MKMTIIELSLKSQQELEIVLHSITREKELLKWEIDRSESKISGFEEKYGMNSENFIIKYNNGELSDDEEIMAWAGEYTFLQKFYVRLRSLEDLIDECQKLMTQ